MKAIIWDWNGTLFDDVQVSIKCMNIVLERHNLPLIEGIDKYRSLFRFPVIEYYSSLGFDFTKCSFEKLASEFIELYNSYSKQCSLVENTLNTLNEISSLRISQMLISASKEEFLKSQISNFNITRFFSRICGITDIYAKSKINLVEKAISECKYNKNEIMMVGDTTHDYEIALKIGCKCILYNNGHQDLKTEEMAKAYYINDLREVIKYIN